LDKPPSARNYFVDETGDANLFSSKGRVIVGTEGCSNYFILGILDIPDPDALAGNLKDLRKLLLADHYFKEVPSMQPKSNKTALAFHAKNDIPEVRREVFSLLRSYDLKFYSVVRNKRLVVEYVRQRNEHSPDYHYRPNELYDYMVRRLFRDRLHKDDVYNIYFARRGKADRTAALQEALERARESFFRRWGILGTAPTNVFPRNIVETPGLQAVDYFLWALQRFYERREDRFLNYLWPAFRLVHDLDDTRQAQYGVYYTQKKPLILAALEKLPGI
jgi:hypothetical protein